MHDLTCEFAQQLAKERRALVVTGVARSVAVQDLAEYFGYCAPIETAYAFPSQGRYLALLVFKDQGIVDSTDWNKYLAMPGVLVEPLSPTHEPLITKCILSKKSDDPQEDLHKSGSTACHFGQDDKTVLNATAPQMTGSDISSISSTYSMLDTHDIQMLDMHALDLQEPEQTPAPRNPSQSSTQTSPPRSTQTYAQTLANGVLAIQKLDRNNF